MKHAVGRRMTHNLLSTPVLALSHMILFLFSVLHSAGVLCSACCLISVAVSWIMQAVG